MDSKRKILLPNKWSLFVLLRRRERSSQHRKWLDILGNHLWIIVVITCLSSACLCFWSQGHIGISMCTGMSVHRQALCRKEHQRNVEQQGQELLVSQVNSPGWPHRWFFCSYLWSHIQLHGCDCFETFQNSTWAHSLHLISSPFEITNVLPSLFCVRILVRIQTFWWWIFAPWFGCGS